MLLSSVGKVLPYAESNGTHIVRNMFESKWIGGKRKTRKYRNTKKQQKHNKKTLKSKKTKNWII
jgi:3-hydroxyacyl-CoA dehydrogenase